MTVSQVGTRVFVAGTTSGIDTAALIDAAVKQRTIRADRLQVEVDENTARIGAYQELETLASALETSLDNLKGNPGFFDDNETAFDLKSGTVTTSDGFDFSSILDISIDKEAIAGSYEIEVTQIAQAQKVIGTSVADKDADLGYTGTFDLGLTGGVTANISIVSTDSLAEIATKINAQSDTTGVNASVIKVSENEYQLSLTGNETNKNIEVTGVTGTDILNSVGVTDGIGGFNNILQIAQESIIEFDGVTITRDDNNYDDLVSGITLDLRSAAPGTTITLDVDNDTTSTKEAIIEFIDTYNALRDFVLTNQEVSELGASENAILFGDNVLEGIANTLSSILSENFGNGGNFQTIRDLGITITDGNKLTLSDETKLDNAILTNFDEVRRAFGASSSTNDPEFTLLSTNSTNNLFRENHPIGVKTDGAGNITSVEVDANSSLFDFSGSTFTGKPGTDYEGLTFSYAGSATSISLEFSFSQGIADRILNSIDGYTSDIDGLIVQEKISLQEENTGKLADAQEIITNAETYRINQIEKFAEFEAKLAQLEILKSQIRAILGNTDDD